MSMGNTGGVMPVVNAKGGKTKQSFKDRADVNKIVERFRRTGMVDHLARVAPAFRDLTGVQDLHSTLNVIAAGRSAFQSLPAVVRSKFENDMTKLVSFISDPKNVHESIALVLVVAPEGYVAPGQTPPAAQTPAERPASPALPAAPAASTVPGTGTAPA